MSKDLAKSVEDTPKPTYPHPSARRGRPPGTKNKTTIFKEAMQMGFEKALKKDFEGVLRAVIKCAQGGDMKAAKLLMDRVVPVSKAVDIDTLSKGGLSINISVGEMSPPEPIEGRIVKEDVEDA